MTVLGRVITIPGKVGDHSTVGGLGMVCNQILRTVGAHLDDGGWPSLSWWVTNLWMVGDPPGDAV